MEVRHRLFIDVDSGDGWLWRLGDPLWDDLLELVEMEARRLMNLYGLGGVAVILRTDDGWHIRFPFARLSKEEELALMWASRGHYGHKWFSREVGDTTLRVSEKPGIRGSHPPYVRRIIRVSQS